LLRVISGTLATNSPDKMKENQLVEELGATKTESAVRAEQIRLLYHQGLPIQLLGVFTAIIAVTMFRQVADLTLLSLWFAAMVLVTVARMILNYRFSKLPTEELDLERWAWLYILGTFVSGILWGSLSLFYQPYWPVAHQIVLFAIFTGIIAGAFNTNSSVKWAFTAFYLPPVLMLMYVMLLRGEGFGELALLFVIYIMLMTISSQRYHQRLTESLRIRVENESLARALEETNRRLMQLSEVDELTQLYNRRTMESYLNEEWVRHRRNAVPLSLLFIDIDCFKQYNDTYGHLSGDEVLRMVAVVFERHARRSTDMAARFGGEEFAIILPETIHADALHIAEEVRQSIEALHQEHKGSTISGVVTVSIGVATKTPGQESQAEELKAAADHALYEAKKQGRNRVV
jgi:diguanylate cyclase (GGDEF)-like protein